MSTSTAFAYERDPENGTNTWLTPRWILDTLGEFDLDPCAFRGWPTAKENFYWPEQDGLWLPWNGRVWCNPPYGSEAQKFVERMALHGNGMLLIFARTETAMFRRVWQTASGILFIDRRIKFLTEQLVESDSGAAPSVIAAFGRTNMDILERSQIGGALVSSWRLR